MKFKKEKSSTKVLSIVHSGSISSVHIANGRNIPVLIIDTTEEKEIEKAILLHKNIDVGKVETIWGKSVNGKKIMLKINMIEPSPSEFMLVFDVVKNYATIDFIINAQLVYIQPGKQEDKLKTTMSAPKILIEVPSSHFYKEWYTVYEKNLAKYFRTKKGMSKRVAKQVAIDTYKEIGKLRDFRMK